MEMAMGIYPFSDAQIAKRTGHSFIQTLDLAEALHRFPQHRNLNRFEGILVIKNPERCLLLFERVNGDTLELSMPSRVYGNASSYQITTFAQKLDIVKDLVEVFIHFEKHGFAYNDAAPRNFMISTTGQTVLIDYDVSLKPKEEAEIMKQRRLFGLFLRGFHQKFNDIAEACISETPATGKDGLGWEEILKRLNALKPTGCCTIM